ncbi:MCE family protein [Aeromicrobium sp. Root495]|uniref:MCE family protein n=1 Tax=Aeromicrobium sp. Root495 TaxID=1736550 RepID=UPI000AA2AE3C|nr:MCE family protein [Aeromicrobium sp. Root495]
MKLDKASFAALIKLIIFLVVTGAATALLMMTMSNIRFESSNKYKAVFTDATGVTKGDDVRIAGVSVGSVKKVEITGKDKAVVEFTVRSATPLTESTQAQLRFRNLVGQRYLNLYKDGTGPTSILKAGSTIPLERTQEALDLTTLLNGFKPVFQALSPSDTNKLAFELVQTLQGESGNVENLLARTSSLTRTLADRDQLIGDVVTNLSQVLDTIGSRDDQLTDTIDTLQQFVTGLKDDRGAILDSIDSISELSTETSNLLVQGRPDLAADVKQLKRVATNLSKPKNLQTVDTALKILPIKLKKLTTLASNGSLFNFYACNINLTLKGLPAEFAQLLEPLLKLKVGGSRCETGGDQ